ncbi:uncharacterized protein BT62DRAFT_1073422 [Guyanagaster necrorhizus]|uniref:F-box domain-containing protein n=1 Tax=Guyanagaster necrorhizus TaxID=856835 RepID=A0A9P7W0P7_9AGAR|nr:uncharacterized protein BT62DRAFT_1073422 [Guyanagaster necrorhizus MCA 3950]KAG7450042.1 hypothetical protein BT62DRAFT_1073422 [Guyanagaster necrorhizus MCA 3950]
MSTRSAPYKRRETRAAATVLAQKIITGGIFGHFLPHDILRLARLTRNFRRFLMHPSSLSCCRASLANVLDLPDPFPGMTEPAWVNLGFNPQCHFFSRVVYIVEWCFRKRLCNRCSHKQCTFTQMEEYAGERHAGRYASGADRQKAIRCKHILQQDFHDLANQFKFIDHPQEKELFKSRQSAMARDIEQCPQQTRRSWLDSRASISAAAERLRLVVGISVTLDFDSHLKI